MSGRIVHQNALETPDSIYSSTYSPLGDVLGVSVDVTAFVATGTLDVSVEWSPDGTNFGPADSSADTITQMTAVSVLSKSFVVKAPFYRIKFLVATEDVTFTAAVLG